MIYNAAILHVLKLTKGPFIVYGQGAEILRGALFGKSPMGGRIYLEVPNGGTFLAAPIFKKPAKPNFLRVLAKNKTKKTSKSVSYI